MLDNRMRSPLAQVNAPASLALTFKRTSARLAPIITSPLVNVTELIAYVPAGTYTALPVANAAVNAALSSVVPSPVAP